MIKCVRTAVEVIDAENPERLAELIGDLDLRAMTMTHEPSTAAYIDWSIYLSLNGFMA